MAPLLLALLLAAVPAFADDRDEGARRFDGAAARAGDPAAAVTSAARDFKPASRLNPAFFSPVADVAAPRLVPPGVVVLPGGSPVTDPPSFAAWVRSLFGSGNAGLERLASVSVVSRDSWNKLTPKHPFEATVPARMTIHHTAIERTFSDTSAEALEIVRRIQREHRARDFDDIGYNFLIDPQGRVIEGRGAEVLGAHSGPQMNEGNVGISVMGHFEKERPTHAQEGALARLGGFLAFAYVMDTSGDAFLIGHRDVENAQTACPGKNAQALLPEWRKAVRESALAMTAKAATEASTRFSPLVVAVPGG